MGALDWLLLAAVAVGVVFALRAHRYGRSGGGCGDCTRCRRTGCDKEKKQARPRWCGKLSPGSHSPAPGRPQTMSRPSAERR